MLVRMLPCTVRRRRPYDCRRRRQGASCGRACPASPAARGQRRRRAPTGRALGGTQVLRDGQETLLCIFDAFLHDPLVDWKNAAAARKAPHAVPGDDGRGALLSVLIFRSRRLTAVCSTRTSCYSHEGKQHLCVTQFFSAMAQL